MKKKLSIILVLSMVLSVFSSFAYAEAPDKLAELLILVKLEKMDQMKALGLKIFNEYLTDDKITELEENVTKYDELKDGLAKDGVTRPIVKELISIAEGLTASDINRLEALKEDAIYIVGNEIAGRIVDAKGSKSNVNFAYELIDSIISKSGIVKYDTYTEKFTISFDDYKKDTKLKSYLKKVFPTAFSSDSIISDRLDIAESVLEYILNEDEDFDEYKEDLLRLLDGYDFFTEYSSEPETEDPGDNDKPDDNNKPGDNDNPGNGGSGGGGGGGGSSSDKIEETPKPEAPKVQDGKAEVELGKDAVEVKENAAGQVVVAVKAENIKAAVENLVAAIQEAPNAKPVVTIKLDDVKTAAMEVSLPQAAMKMLSENKVDLVIESKALSYEVPAVALEAALKGIADDAQVEFNSKEVSVEVAKELFIDENVAKTAKIIEFNLLIKDKDGNEIGKVNKFDTKIRIGIEIKENDGNPDLLAVFHINEESNKLDFVGGKIKGNKIFMTTDHYSKFAIVEYDKSFSDIEDHWAKDYVKSMVAKHVVDGFAEENIYKPEESLTRAQFAKLLVETLEVEEVTFKGEFVDVANNHWAKDYIATAKAAGIIGGYDDGTFRPDQSVTRTEMAVMIANSLELRKSTSRIALSKFNDSANIPAWAVESVVPVIEEKILVGSNGELNPLGTVTRAEAATIIYRIYNR